MRTESSNRLSALVGSRGFTLIEVMIALVLLALLMAVLLSGLRLGAISWDRAEEEARVAADRAQIGAFLQRYLERAEPVFDSREEGGSQWFSLAFEGESDRISWVSALPAHRGGGGLHRMSLEVSREGQDQGLVLEYRLWHPDTVGTDAAVERQMILEGAESMKIDYLGFDLRDGTRAWTDAWKDRNEMPLLVRLRLQHESGVWPEMVAAPRQAAGDSLRFSPARR